MIRSQKKSAKKSSIIYNTKKKSKALQDEDAKELNIFLDSILNEKEC